MKMKTLLIVRHGKSSWKDATLSDLQRPLKKRGVKQSDFIGRLLLETELVPQLILTSPAERARQTAEIIAGLCLVSEPLEITESFYLAEPEAYIKALSALPDKIERVMVVGHNPGLEALIQLFDHKVDNLSTGSLAYLVLNLQEWSKLTSETPGDLIGYWKIPVEGRQSETKKDKHQKDDKKNSNSDKESKIGKGEPAMKEGKEKKEKKGKKDKKDKKDKKKNKDEGDELRRSMRKKARKGKLDR